MCKFYVTAQNNKGLYPSCSYCTISLGAAQFGSYLGVVKVVSWTEWEIRCEMIYDCNPNYPYFMYWNCWTFVVNPVVYTTYRTALNTEMRSDRRCCCFRICAYQALRTTKIIEANYFVNGQANNFNYQMDNIAYLNTTISNNFSANTFFNIQGNVKLKYQQQTANALSSNLLYTKTCNFDIP